MRLFCLGELVEDDSEFTLTAHERHKGPPAKPEASAFRTDEAVKPSCVASTGLSREFEASLEKRDGRRADEDVVGLTGIAEHGKGGFCRAFVLGPDLCDAVDSIHH